MNLLNAIKNLSDAIAIANETLQVCIRELQLRERRELELAKNCEEMSLVEHALKFLKKDNLQWVKFADEIPTEKGCYVLSNPALGEICSRFVSLQEALSLAHLYKAWLKIPDFKDVK